VPDLTVTRILPNPTGKDRSSGSVMNQQLNAEWVEFQNTSGRQLNLEGVAMLHRTFDSLCRSGGDDWLTNFNGLMPNGHSIRVHSGEGEPHDDAHDPTLRHLFLNRKNFVWNNRCGDRPALRVSDGEIDHAYYDPNPPEGTVLKRVPGTNRLQR
jgi:hypothetical protein